MTVFNTFIVTDPNYERHLTGRGHPETPKRHSEIDKVLRKKKLLTNANCLSPRVCTEDEIALCHTKEYLEIVDAEVSDCKEGAIFQLSTGDVNVCSDSYHIAKLAVGGVFTAVDSVMENIAKKVFCNIRPPGHHACSDMGMGFCLFNNIALGARYAQNKYGVERVLIVDWDVHHGNGTQEIFYNDPSVFYFSTHQGNYYPFTGKASETGEHDNICNVPIMPSKNSRNKLIEAFHDKLVPKMQAFKPNLVMISAGFDAHKDDGIAHLNLVEDDYRILTEIVCKIANEYSEGKIISVLEGGYNLRALSSSVAVHIETLNSD
ncbi:MAG: histone deacetylase [Chlamydiota bacterium]|nr:histone deacetylase [Chlamydiota bacterium]